MLCSYPAIKDLLDKRGETYADRPVMPIVEMCALSGVYLSCQSSTALTMRSRTGMDWILPNARKSKVWREGRKLLNRSLRPGATMSYRQMMLENTRGTLARLLTTPEDFLGHIGLSVATIPFFLISYYN